MKVKIALAFIISGCFLFQGGVKAFNSSCPVLHPASRTPATAIPISTLFIETPRLVLGLVHCKGNSVQDNSLSVMIPTPACALPRGIPHG